LISFCASARAWSWLSLLRPRAAHEVTRIVARLDAIEVQTLIDQLPDGLVALRGGFFQRPIAGLGQSNRQSAHASLILVF